MNEVERNSKAYIGYEYKEFQTGSDKVSMYIDGYRSFGWEIDENKNVTDDKHKPFICLKRDRKIMNKAELTRLQKNFEDCMDKADILERSKKSKASIAAMVIGMIGTVFIAGSTFAVTSDPPVIWLCVLLAVPGFAGWILPYFCYKTVVRKRSDIVVPLIEDIYEEIYEICKKGNELLGKPAVSMDET